jgi:hypothetical protein
VQPVGWQQEQRCAEGEHKQVINQVSVVIYSGGGATGEVTDGLYTGGVYTPGTQVTSYTLASVVTGSGSRMGGL